MRPGPQNLITDVAGLKVGNADDPKLKSGVTVLTADKPFTASVHVMGGAPGTRETDLLAPDRLVSEIDAIVLSGGSAFGLAAADGVAGALRDAGRGFEAAGHRVPIVPAAILFDLAAGGETGWSANPYLELGRAAFAAADHDFALGSVGAGTGATTATLKGGLGSASAMLSSGIGVGALVAANPVGDVIHGDGPGFWAAPFEEAAEFGGRPVTGPAGQPRTKLGPGTATTIAIVATDAALDKAACHRVAVTAHDGIARAIVPSHTPFDGDLVFAAATGVRPAPSPPDLLEIGHWAAVCLARAIARAVFLARPASGDVKPCWSDLHRN
ncbi:MAG: P1 family peptidase [Paracoccaceae bacterium]|nr:P1 family peptidase [Paracoccaceae bacterium]